MTDGRAGGQAAEEEADVEEEDVEEEEGGRREGGGRGVTTLSLVPPSSSPTENGLVAKTKHPGDFFYCNNCVT